MNIQFVEMRKKVVEWMSNSRHVLSVIGVMVLLATAVTLVSARSLGIVPTDSPLPTPTDFYWYCPSDPECEVDATPTPNPTPTCRPTITCPPTYPTSTPYPTQPPYVPSAGRITNRRFDRR